MVRYIGSCVFVLLLCSPTPLLARPNFEVEVLKRSVVQILGQQGRAKGSGFVINPDGYVGTNQHIVKGSRKVWVRTANPARKLSADIVATSPQLDLAVLRVPGLNLPPVKFSLAGLKTGQRVWAIGYVIAGGGPIDYEPSDYSDVFVGGGPSIQDGVIGRIFIRAWPGLSEPLTMIQHNVPTNHGDSGGPLLDDCGRVVGVNTTDTSTIIPGSSDDVVGILLSSHIREMADLLSREGIAFEHDKAVCVASDNAGEAEPQAMIIVGLLLSATVLAALVLVLKRSRQQIVYVAERASRLVSGRGGARREKSAVGVSSTCGLVLSGCDNQGKRVHVTLSPARFAGLRLGLSLGRHPELVDEVVDGNSVSRRHLRISQRSGRFYVEDLNSTNGTFINHRRLEPFRLESLEYNSVIALGSLKLDVSRL